MKITKKRIRSLGSYLKAVPQGQEVVPGLLDTEGNLARLEEIGFTVPLVQGETLLPPAVGPATLFNAEGREIVRKDLPMEEASQQREWTWTEWHGPYDQVERSKIVDIPYKRYPRDFVPPPGAELSIAKAPDDTLVVVSPSKAYTEENADSLVSQINVFLELFGECDILSAEHAPIAGAAVKRLNWDILPPGEMPWEQLEKHLKPLVDQLPEGKRPPAYHRTKALNELGLTLHATGRAGFSGYLVFKVSDQDLYFLESLLYGNATYVVGEDWQRLSQMTKAEILSGNLHEARLIHNEGWEDRVQAAIA